MNTASDKATETTTPCPWTVDEAVKMLNEARTPAAVDSAIRRLAMAQKAAKEAAR